MSAYPNNLYGTILVPSLSTFTDSSGGGSNGNIGPTGPADSIGSIDPTGPTGSNGSSGPTGSAGSNGSIGPSGPTGSFTGTTNSANIMTLTAGTGYFTSLTAGTSTFLTATLTGTGTSFSLGNARLSVTGLAMTFQNPILLASGASGSSSSTLTSDTNCNATFSGGLSLGGNLTGTSATLSSGLTVSSNITGSTLTLLGTGSATLSATIVKAQFITASGSFVSQGSANFSSQSTSGTLAATQVVAGTELFISLSAVTGSFTTLAVNNTTNTAEKQTGWQRQQYVSAGQMKILVNSSSRTPWR